MLRVFKPGFDFAKKAFLVFAVFFVVFAIFGNVINNNRPRYDEKKILSHYQKEMYSVLTDARFKKNNTTKITLISYRFLMCTFIGELCTDTPPTDLSYFNKSIIGRTSALIPLPYVNPPASGAYWVTNTLQNAGFIPQSYAAEGIGFAMIKPLMNLWKIFRDIAYLVIVIFLIAIGFMIMFRVKMNPQTVISVENSLPKIVVSLLLITFSFAIAGFLVDAMYLLIVLAIGILSNNNTYYNTNHMQNTMLQSNFGTLWDAILPLPPDAKNLIGLPRFAYIGDAFMALLPTEINTWSHILVVVAGAIFGTQFVMQLVEWSGITDFLSNLAAGTFSFGKLPKAIFGPVMIFIVVQIFIQLLINGFGFIFGFIVSLAITGMLFNIFFILLRSYIQITLTIVFSPIILLFEALPGNNNFSFWLKGLIGELMTFPIVIALLLVEKVMFMTMTYPGEFWTPPFLVNLNPAAFSVIFGLGMILITPDIIKLVKDAIGAKPLPFNLGLGTFMSGGGAVIGGGMGILQQFSTLSLGITGIQNLSKMVQTKSQKEYAERAEEQRKAANLAGGVAERK